MSKKKTEVSEPSTVKDLTNYINSFYKKNNDKVAFSLDGSDFNPSDVTDYIPSGNDILDIVISNRKNGGFPVGRITEISGMEASGKSLLACHALKSTIEKDGIAVYIDTENAASDEFMKAIGLDLKKLIYISENVLENIFELIEKFILKLRESDPDKLVTIVIDSVMGATTKLETETNFDKKGFNTSKSIILSQSMRKITHLIGKQRVCLILTNQLRINLNMPPNSPDHYTTSGGKGIAFHSSLRLRLEQKKKLFVGSKEDKIKDFIGVETAVHVMKNRLAPPHRKVKYNIYYNSGMDNYNSWLEEMKNHKLVDLNGSWYTYRVVNPETGEVLDTIKFLSKDFYDKVIANPKYKELLYNQLCDALIFKYEKDSKVDIDNLIIEEDFEDEY
jgi:recombination protein RecA